MALKCYISVTKTLKLKVKKLWGLIPTFVEVTKEKLDPPPFSSWIGLKQIILIDKTIDQIRFSFLSKGTCAQFDFKGNKKYHSVVLHYEKLCRAPASTNNGIFNLMLCYVIVVENFY